MDSIGSLTAAPAGNINWLYRQIECNPYVLENIETIPFVETPLHTAPSAGHVQLATEIIRLKPSFAWKLNQQGFSPMHLALQNHHDSMVRRFLSINKDLVRIKGKEGRTPLHYVAQTGQTDILAEFLSACPDSIQDLTVQGETALHTAVCNQRLAALRVLVGWLRRSSYLYQLRQSILNWKNDSGDTILHVAARINDEQIVRFLIRKGINLNAKNSENLTALDIVEMPATANDAIRNMLLNAKALRGAAVTDAPTLAVKLASNITFLDAIAIAIDRISRATLDDKARSAALVVAVLIATMTYQSSLNPPGGVYHVVGSGNSTSTSTLQGKSVLATRYFLFFWLVNTISLLVSTIVIIFLLPVGLSSIPLMGGIVYITSGFLFNLRIIAPGDFFPSFNLDLTYAVVIIYSVLLLLKVEVHRRVRTRNTESESSGGNRW